MRQQKMPISSWFAAWHWPDALHKNSNQDFIQKSPDPLSHRYRRSAPKAHRHSASIVYPSQFNNNGFLQNANNLHQTLRG